MILGVMFTNLAIQVQGPQTAKANEVTIPWVITKGGCSGTGSWHCHIGYIPLYTHDHHDPPVDSGHNIPVNIDELMMC